MEYTNKIYTLDLHGMYELEARAVLSHTIDRCFYYGYTAIKVICGLGHGTLYRMAIEECENNPLVEPCGTYGITDQGYIFIYLQPQ